MGATARCKTRSMTGSLSVTDDDFDKGFQQAWGEVLEAQAREIGRLIGLVRMDDRARRKLLRTVREAMTQAAVEERSKRP